MNETSLHVLHFNTYFAWKKKKYRRRWRSVNKIYIKLKGLKTNKPLGIKILYILKKTKIIQHTHIDIQHKKKNIIG